MPKVSCIIPVYNEGPRIANVLQVVCNHPLINEVIVVNDASKDSSAEEAKKFNAVRLINHPQNKGKTQAVLTGVKESKYDFVLLLDSDLVGLTQKVITDLIEPVESGLAGVSISLRSNAPWVDRLIGIDLLSGERVLPKKLILSHINEISKLPKFGLESYLNKIIIQQGLKIKIVWWPGVISPWKYKKNGLWAGIKGDFFMIKDILKTVNIFEFILMYYKMLKLNIKNS